MSKIPDNTKKIVRVNFRRIRKHAKENRWSGMRIAETSGELTASTAVKILKGETANPGAVTLKHLCDVIGFPIEKAFIVSTKKAA